MGLAAEPAGPAGVVFEPVRFVKLNAIAAAALDFAKTGAEIALGLIGVLALFLGLLKIAEDAGIVFALVKLVRPILRPLFPEVPPDHPALGMIALNLTATVFGLGNAATPFGIKAMEELQKLNPSKDTATNSMVMLLAINTAGVQLVPPVLLLALMGTADQHAHLPDPHHDRAGAHRRHRRRKTARPAPRLSRVRPQPDRPEVAMETARNAISLLSYFVLPLILVGFPLYGLYKRVPVYESFVEGAKDGFQVAVRIIPYLVAILFAIAMFRASGAMEALTRGLDPVLGLIGFPAELLPMAIIRSLSGSGSAALVVDMINQYGEDSIFVKMAAVMYGSSETTFYVIAVYFGAVGIKKTRHAVPAGLIADAAAMIIAVWTVRLLFG